MVDASIHHPHFWEESLKDNLIFYTEKTLISEIAPSAQNLKISS